jgi:YggT family protein
MTPVLAILNFLFLIIKFALDAVVWLVIANAVVSWLIAFDVINLRNRTAYGVVRFLDQVTRPLLAPLRRIIPSFAGLDVTPMILIIVITAAQATLLPALFGWLAGLVG